MQAIETDQRRAEPGRCPVHHGAGPKTARPAAPTTRRVEQSADGTWYVRGFAEARAVLRASDTKQAGFKAELIERIPGAINSPILYLEGKPHHEQRKQTARFFTPKATSDNYRALMEAQASALIAKLRKVGRANLDDLSMIMAVRVAGQVVGLTNSIIPGMDRRLDAFFMNDQANEGQAKRTPMETLRNRLRMAAFYFLDVLPAIRARRRKPQEDVISHLLGRNYSNTEILTECVTYGAAGMATTREFISIAAWHMLENPELRAQFLAAPEEERYQILHETLRLEPIVGNLFRRTTADVTLNSEGQQITIPSGALVNIDIFAANADETLVGERPQELCPARTLSDERVNHAVMSFGDGHHRCPGAYIAIQESDIFLRQLLAIEGLRIERKPDVTFNELVTGYEVRDFVIAVG